MSFINEVNKGNNGGGTYFLTIILVFLSLLVGQSCVELIAKYQLGYSLIDIPKKADLNVAFMLLLIPFSFIFLTLLLCVRYIHKRSVLSLFTSRKSFDWKRFIFAFLLWGVIMGAFLIGDILMGEPIDLNIDTATFLPLLLISILILPIQTSAEELFFRGYLFQLFGLFFKKGWIAILLSAWIFGMMHMANPEVLEIGSVLIIYYVGTGIFLGIIAHMDDGIELGMGYHAINNIFAALILTNNWQAFQTDAIFIDNSPPAFGLETVLSLLIISPVILLIFSKVYQWKNWKQKMLN